MFKIFILFFTLSATLVYGQDHLLEENFKRKEFKRPLREISIIVTEDGFYPNKIMAFQGEKVHFYITSTSTKNQCFLLQKHDVFIAAEKGRVNEIEITVDAPGRFKFYCPSSKFQGHFTVFEKFAPEEKEKAGRAIASEGKANKPTYWLPRDYD